MKRTKKQIRAAQLVFAKYLLAGIEAQIVMLHRVQKAIDRAAVKAMKDAILDCHDSIEYKAEQEGIVFKNPRSRRS